MIKVAFSGILKFDRGILISFDKFLLDLLNMSKTAAANKHTHKSTVKPFLHKIIFVVN